MCVAPRQNPNYILSRSIKFDPFKSTPRKAKIRPQKNSSRDRREKGNQSRAQRARGDNKTQGQKPFRRIPHHGSCMCIQTLLHLTFAKKCGTLMTLKSLINETFPDSERHSGTKIAPPRPGAMSDLVACEHYHLDNQHLGLTIPQRKITRSTHPAPLLRPPDNLRDG